MPPIGSGPAAPLAGERGSPARRRPDARIRQATVQWPRLGGARHVVPACAALPGSPAIDSGRAIPGALQGRRRSATLPRGGAVPQRGRPWSRRSPKTSKRGTVLSARASASRSGPQLGGACPGSAARSPSELGLEVERLCAGSALVEVLGDLRRSSRVELAVAGRGSACDRLFALRSGCDVGRPGSGRRRRAPGRRDPGTRRTRTTPSAAAFFPVQPAHHGTDRDVEDLGDLLVGEALDVGEQHGHAGTARGGPRWPPSPRPR